MNPCEERLKTLRQNMVKEQLLGRDIKSKDVLDVFSRVPRHRFIDTSLQRDAYGDFPLSIGKGQTISQPYMVALMVQALELTKEDKILEIGTGSGYETAILAELAGQIFSMERIREIGLKAQEVLKDLGYRNVEIKIDDGTLGWEVHAPFDKIIVTASSQSVPGPLLEQLSNNGKMVMPVGPRATQRLMLLEKDSQGKVSEKDVCGCVFVPLIGKYGWSENNAGKNI